MREYADAADGSTTRRTTGVCTGVGMSEITAGRATPQQSIEVALALAAIVDSSQEAVIAKDLDGVITAWNPGATLVYGQSAGEMIGRRFETVVPAHALDEERTRHARAADGEASSGFRTSRLRADGNLVEVVMSLSPVRDDQGVITGVASISRPVSNEEREAARSASLLEAVPEGIFFVTVHGVILTANTRGAQMFGYEPAELVGTQIEMLLPLDARPRHLERRERFLTTMRLEAEELPPTSGLRRDGTTFPIEVILALDHSGPEPIVITALRDVTAQRAAEEAARENESRLRQLAESVETVFILRQIDPPENLYVSPGSAKILGVGPEALMSDPGAIVMHPDDHERVHRTFVDPSRLGLPAHSEHRIILADGSERWIRSVATPVPNPVGPPERYVITAEDITPRMAAAEHLREAEHTARAANAAKNIFLSRMSHELRTPLNAVLGFGQLLEFELAGTPHEEEVAQILKGGRHLLNLINDVLDVARIESGEMSVSLEPVPTDDLVAESMQLMASMAQQAGITLLHTPGLEGWHVLADRQRLRQILLNLLSNAIKYNHPGGSVWVEQSLVGDEIAITVRDDGPGVPHALQDRLFTPFDRLGAESTGIDGTGIGLTLTRSLSALMSGSVTVDSELGRGSAFTVSLPRAIPAHLGTGARAEDGTAQLVEQGPGARSLTLLYVEDNVPNVQIIEHLLRLRPRWRLIHAGSGGLGLELARAHRPDLVLLDLHLPDRSGADVLRALKDDPDTHEAPVLILTADATAGQSRRLLELGAEQYLTKPLDLREILAALDRVGAGVDAG